MPSHHRSHQREPRYEQSMDDVGYAPSSTSSSDNSDRGTQSKYSSSSRVLAHVLARKERDSKQMQQLLKLTFTKLDEESQRATDAERRAAECLVRARTAMDARAQADADAAAARAELAMYKMQLEQAQREIFRAQELLDGLEARRHDAEEEAARSRSVARKLQEERAVEAAREQGKQLGYQEGVRRGVLLGRQEAENELRTRRREDELRSRSRPRGLQDALFSEASPNPRQQSSSDRSSPVDVPRGAPEAGNGRRRTPDVAPMAPAPSVPTLTTPFRSPSPDQPTYANPTIRRRMHTPEPFRHEQPEPRYESPPQSHSRHRSHSRSRPYMPAPAPELAHSRPYTPNEDSTPSIIQPIPIPASPADTFPLRAPPNPPHVRHTPVQIPPDNWIPHAQDAAGDGQLSIYLPPPHELAEPPRVPDDMFEVAASPEDASPVGIPPPPDLSPSPEPHAIHSRDYAFETPPPQENAPMLQTPGPSRTRNYAFTPPPPDLGPVLPVPGPSRTRDYANAPLPPPPSLGATGDERSYAPQRIAKSMSNHSRASTHLSEFDLLAPVEQPRAPSNIGPAPAEEDELEYVDVATEPIPRQPIAPEPNLQRRRAYEKRPMRGPPRPRNIIMPAPLSQVAEQLAGPSSSQAPPAPPPHVYTPAPQAQDEDGYALQAERSRPQRSRTQSSGVIGISVEPPSPEGSPPSSGNNTGLVQRADLLSPKHAELPLPMRTVDAFVARMQTHNTHPIAHLQQPSPPQTLTPLPELADIPSNFIPPVASSSSDSRRHPHGHGHGHRRGARYEAAPVPSDVEYPASPLGALPRKMRVHDPAPAPAPAGDTPLSPLSTSSGFLSFKPRLPWRRNTAKH
ncbi:hypothetical protein BC834DRAFT_428415 [Gloeopeniophorella convolvens]|nr:hypothetical protein BC834DRAFT_428415 [Gloeopeniophorella convolvens]